LEKGKAILSEEREYHPENLIPLLLDNYIDFLKIVISEDERQLAMFKQEKNRRISALKKGDENSPWFLHAQAEIHLQYALAALMFREYVGGILDLRKAYSLLEENNARHPAFKPGINSYLVIQSLLGVIPERYHRALKLFGLSGNLEKAMQGLEQLTQQDWGEFDFLKKEAVLTYAMLLLHLKGDRKTAWETVRAQFPAEGNLLSYYVAMKIALYSFHNEEALQMIENIPSSGDYPEIPMMEYYKGLARLQKLDTHAIAHFQDFLKNTKSRNHIKSAYHKIAWGYLVKDNSEEYAKHMRLAKANGITQAEADKQAQREAENPVPPHPQLLKARLLFDGGYFRQALEILKETRLDSLPLKQYQLEYVYREARILDEMGDTVRAIERYMVTLNHGRNEPFYYAANAALHLGLIYEEKGNRGLAKKYFTECLEMQNHEYKVSLSQKAKAGLERLK